MDHIGENVLQSVQSTHFANLLSILYLEKLMALSIADYFQKAQNLAQMLAAIDEPLKNSKLISYLIVGLSSDYDLLV